MRDEYGRAHRYGDPQFSFVGKGITRVCVCVLKVSRSGDEFGAKTNVALSYLFQYFVCSWVSDELRKCAISVPVSKLFRSTFIPNAVDELDTPRSLILPPRGLRLSAVTASHSHHGLLR